MSVKKDILWRVALVYFGIILFAVVIAGKTMYIQFAEGSMWQERASRMTIRDITIEPNRGDIYASGSRLLATSMPYYEVRMDLRAAGLTDRIFNENIDSLCLALAGMFEGKSAAAWRAELNMARQEWKRFHLIGRRVSFDQLREIRRFPLFRLGQNTGGLIVIQDNQRFQPHGNLASRTIGYTTKGESGNIVGIEGAYDIQLSGVEGLKLMQRISGNAWMPLNDRNEVEPRDGLDVVTTIDIDIQDVATNALLRQLSAHRANHGTAILMEVQTGEIKAIANLERNSRGGYSETYNYALGESTEPGSTFKLMSLLVALEDGYIKLEDSIDTRSGEIYFYDQRIADSRRGGHGRITVQEVFELSSNVGVAKLIDRFYRGREQEFINKLYRMNLNQKTGVEIRGEGRPEIKHPGDRLWSGISLPMMSIGYEIRMTPLQILTFYNAIANDGRMVRPKFVSELRYHGNTVEVFPTRVINPSISSPRAIRSARKMLEGVVESGTAMNLRNANYRIAGKTGTAQIANEKYGYVMDSRVSHQASFVGYFPADNPRYSCIVVVNSPSNNVYYGNLVAGPVFREIADKVYSTSLDMHEPLIARSSVDYDPPFSKSGNLNDLETVFTYFGIPALKNGEPAEWVTTTRRDSFVELRGRTIVDEFVPNVVDMTLSDALYLLENRGLVVEARGRGKVNSQSLLPGLLATPGRRIVLEMSIN
ncbi:MAG: PASTA domain-containing protein [Marinilabiliales bacterium]|nr:MAG: PASTA domain-containing protein [Marinilabiliales bacterium]